MKTLEWVRARTLGEGCWLWKHPFRDRDGYAYTTVDGARIGAHRVAWMAAHGPIPEGMTVDHLCFVRHCVNPQHLRLLPREMNCANQRSAAKPHCVRGHEFTDANTYRPSKGGRVCRACSAARSATYRGRTQ